MYAKPDETYLIMSVKKKSNIIHSCVSEPNEACPFCIRFEQINRCGVYEDGNVCVPVRVYSLIM